MEIDDNKRKEVAERVRLAVKELRWAASNLERVYGIFRTEDDPPIEPDDPNQLDLFAHIKNN